MKINGWLITGLFVLCLWLIVAYIFEENAGKERVLARAKVNFADCIAAKKAQWGEDAPWNVIYPRCEYVRDTAVELSMGGIRDRALFFAGAPIIGAGILAAAVFAMVRWIKIKLRRKPISSETISLP